MGEGLPLAATGTRRRNRSYYKNVVPSVQEKNEYNQSVVWSETPCVCLHKDSVHRHSLSQQHKTAIELELCREESQPTGSVEQAFQSQIALNRSAAKVAMECLYWIIKSEIPHTTHYNSLVKAVEFMGCNQLKHLHHGENAI